MPIVPLPTSVARLLVALGLGTGGAWRGLDILCTNRGESTRPVGGWLA
jgi:hypothetical protein